MNPLLHWLTSPEWTQVVGTLLHSLWQGAVIAIALAVLMRRVTNPVTRYRCALGMLGLLVTASIVTWAVLNTPKTTTKTTSTFPVAESEFPPTPSTSLNPDAAAKVIVIGKMSPPAAPTNWTAWLALVWIVGAAVMLLRASIKVAGAENLRRSCKPLDDERMITLVAEACRMVDLARKIRVAVTDKLTSPAVVGIIVPTLILPLSLFSALTPEQIRFVLLHELAHIRRGDYLANLFQLFAEALLFFNPAVWWISHQIRREREACCDALAIELSGAPADYARTLVRVAENILQPTTTAALAFGDDDREPSPLADRVQRLLVPGYRPALRLTWRAMLAAMCISGTLLFLSAIGARNVVGAVSSNVTDTASKPATNVLEKINGPADSKNDSFTQPKWERSWNPRFEKQKTSNGGTVMPWFAPDEEVLAVLKQIKFERVFYQNQKLSEVLAELEKALLATDTKKIGFRLLMPPDWAYPAKRDGIESVMINMPSELRDTTMLNLLESIVSNASRPIQYKIGGIGAHFEMKFDMPTNIWFRQFRVYHKTFLPFIGIDDSTIADLRLKNDTAAESKTSDAIKKRFLQAGVDLRPPNHVLYKIGADRLYVHAPKKDIESIEELLKGITPKAPGSSSNPPTTTNRLSKDSVPKLTLPSHTISSAAQVSAALPSDIESMLSPARGRNLWPPDGQTPLNSHQFSYRTDPTVDDLRAKNIRFASLIVTAQPTNSPTQTNISLPNNLQTISNKLDQIRLDKVYYEHRPLGEVIRDLTEKAKQSDPEKNGVNFTLDSNAQKIDPATGLKSNSDSNDLSSVLITLQPETRKADLKYLLDKIVTYADKPIKYVITDHGVVFEAADASESKRLFTREFNISSKLFAEKILTNLVQVEWNRVPLSSHSVMARESFRAWLTKIGVDLNSQRGKTFSYNERAGVLLVRANLKELDAIEMAVMSWNEASTTLITRTFQVEPGAIKVAIESLFPQFNPVTSTNFLDSIRALLESSGVDLSLPKSVFYNDRAGGLFVRATKEDLDAIESFLKVLGQQPAQVNIKALFVELPFGKGQPKELTKILGPITRENETNFTGILTASQFKTILRVLETSADIKILERPQVTTLSGRQAQLQVTDVRTIINGVSATGVVKNGSTNLIYQSQAMSFGTVLDVLPIVSNDGYTVQLTLTPKFTEFLGYEDPKKLNLPVPADKASMPLPIIRIRQITTSASVWDGQTIVLGNFSDQMLDTPTGLKGTAKTSDKKPSKQILVFVTPTIIDSTGNPANKDLGIPSRLIPNF